MKVRNKIIARLLEIIFDAGFVLLAFVLAFYVRIGAFKSTDFPFDPYFKLALFITPLFILLFIWSGLYSFSSKNLFQKLHAISFSALVGSMAFVLIFFFNREVFFSRAIVLFVFLFSTFFVWIFHALLFFYRRNKWKKGKNIHNTLIIGANRATEKVIKNLKNKTEYFPVAILAPYGSKKKEILGIPVVGKLDALEKTVENYQIDEIIQCDAVEQSLNLIAFAEGKFLGFKIAPEVLGAFHKNIEPEKISSVSFLSLNLSPLFGWGQFFKRIFDILFSVLFLPFLLVIYLIKRPFGKVFATEKRARGFDDEFNMLRFSDNGALGKFFKKTYLLDLPAFWNVFKGEMSVIGPRPSTIKDRENYPLHFRRRLILKPGITGAWQLAKMQGAEDDTLLMLEKDLNYIHGWNFGLDLKILFKSFYLVLKKVFK